MLTTVAVALLVLAVIEYQRYGTTYLVGDTQHVRDDGIDWLRFALPGAAAAVAAVLAVLGALTPDGFRKEWDRELELLREAREAERGK